MFVSITSLSACRNHQSVHFCLPQTLIFLATRDIKLLLMIISKHIYKQYQLFINNMENACQVQTVLFFVFQKTIKFVTS